MKDPALWWQKGSIYQVYLRSFKDGNADGVGDLRGLQERLDYLQWLGVDALWLSPLYPSPMADFGYDVANYKDVDPLFGSLAELDSVISAAHSRNLKVILDFVPNHTSDQHPWFKAARSSRSDPKRDFYIWRDGTPDKPPNNWLAAFGGPAWTWDEATSQYYYHAFLPQQPDLNWRNPEVRAAMYDCMRFWLERGVDGFRMDVLWHLIKDEQFRDNPPNPDYDPNDIPYNSLLPTYSTDQPEVHDIVKEMRALLDEYSERLLIGEIYLPIGKLVAYYGTADDGAHLPFNFQLITLPWNARKISAAISEYEGALPAGAWPNWVLGNHDQPRIASRVGLAQARVAAMLLLTLRGTPTIYYGDEIGMQDAALLPSEIQDPQGKNVGVSRDPQRTPMQWNNQANAGFSATTPWLPVSVDYPLRNVESERVAESSMLSLYRRLLELRRQHSALSIGLYRPLPSDADVIAYVREHGEERFLCVLNLGHRPQSFSLENVGGGEIVAGSERGREGQRVSGWLRLTGDDGVVVKLDPAT